MNIQTEKLELMKMILETDNPDILRSLKEIFSNKEEDDYWDSLSGDEKADILAGIRDIENGNVIDYEEFMAKYRNFA